MDIALIFLTSIGAVLLSNHLARRGPLARADLAIGLTGGLFGASLAQFLSVEGAGWSLGLPLLLTGCLALGLESLRDRPALRWYTWAEVIPRFVMLSRSETSLENRGFWRDPWPKGHPGCGLAQDDKTVKLFQPQCTSTVLSFKF